MDRKQALEIISNAFESIKARSIQSETPDGHRFEWLHAKQIDWPDFKAKAICDLESVIIPGEPVDITLLDICGIVDRMLMRLGDQHSILHHPGVYIRTIHPDFVENNDPRDQKKYTWAWHKELFWQNSKHFHNGADAAASRVPMPTVEYVRGENILRVTLPQTMFPFKGHQWQAYQSIIRNGLLRAADAHARREKPLKGIIIDLRPSHGGSMCPIIGGLAPMLGSGTLGHFSSPNPRHTHRWDVNIGAADSDESLRDSPLANIPAAVLINNGTCSAGEIVFLALRGRPNTYSFGMPTYGNSTGNGHVELIPEMNLGFALCDSLTLDRFGEGSGDGNRSLDGGPINPDFISKEPFNAAMLFIKNPDLVRASPFAKKRTERHARAEGQRLSQQNTDPRCPGSRKREPSARKASP